MRRRLIANSVLVALALVAGCRSPDRQAGNPVLPTVIVTHDDMVIAQSCWVEIPAGTVIADAHTAEERVSQGLRQLGQELLGQWVPEAAAQAQAEVPRASPEACRHGEKKS